MKQSKFKIGDLVVWNSPHREDHPENGDIGIVLKYDSDGCSYFWCIAGFSTHTDNFIDNCSSLLYSPQEETLK